ncbi:uncharacterized protein [Branchiostoma lanceolatum]|uniref:uncharacterized protein n=1 Tax=Branchiostoma lanceolatum TaxID=7740 RepID=UPI0034563B08
MFFTYIKPRLFAMDAAIVVTIIVLTGPTVQTADVPCRTFEDIYPSGKELCEQMWGPAFVYETNLSLGFTMWFFEAENPNDKVAQRLGWPSPADECHYGGSLKEAPGPEPDNFTECHPWQDYSCCHLDTIQRINEAYGRVWHWEKCGALSPACNRFFVQQACLVECEPSTGFYRKYPDDIYNASNPNHSKYAIEGMPIRADYCDAWLRTCRYDHFCATDSGAYTPCAREDAADPDENTGGNVGLIAGVVIACLVVAALLATLVYFIFKERKGQPVFNKLET